MNACNVDRSSEDFNAPTVTETTNRFRLQLVFRTRQSVCIRRFHKVVKPTDTGVLNVMVALWAKASLTV